MTGLRLTRLGGVQAKDEEERRKEGEGATICCCCTGRVLLVLECIAAHTACGERTAGRRTRASSSAAGLANSGQAHGTVARHICMHVYYPELESRCASQPLDASEPEPHSPQLRPARSSKMLHHLTRSCFWGCAQLTEARREYVLILSV